MSRWFFGYGLWLACLASQPAAAQFEQAGEDDVEVGEHADRLANPSVAPTPSSRGGDTAEPTSEGERWLGPSVEFGYARYWLGDGNGGGLVHAAEFGGFVPIRYVRLGARAEVGVRDYSFGSGDLVARATLTVGYQETERLGRFAPYLAGIATYGAVVGTRFHTSLSWIIRGLGFEVGGALRLFKTVSVGAGLTYTRASMDGLAFNLVLFRASIAL